MKQFIMALVLIFIFQIQAHAQLSELESLKISLHTQKDSLRQVDALNRISILMYEKNIDSTFLHVKLAREKAERLNYE